jgi:hypothetical protein
MSSSEERLRRLEAEIERKLLERFAALRDEFDRLRVEADQRWAGFLSRFDQDFRGIVPPELVEEAPAALPAPATPAAPGRGALSLAAARALDEAPNQVDALNKYLELAQGFASRAALLIARGETLAVWKAIGFSRHGGSDEATRRAAVSTTENPALTRVLGGVAVELSADNEVSRQLSASDASRAVLVPMVVKEKVSGTLYADCVPGEEESFDPDAIGLLTYLAGLVVDRLATRKLKPAPALKVLEPLRERRRQTEAPLDLTPEAEPQPATEFELVSDSTNPPAPAAPPPSPPPLPPAAPRPEDTSPGDGRPAASPALNFEDSSPGSGFRMSRADVLAAASTPSPPPPAGTPAAAAPPPPAAPVSTGARPSLGARRLAGPLAPADGDERREEARRFAKLLVSEIKLYNERAVLEGREHGDIYERLKEDIDRSRQMYDERIPEDVRAGSNFFHEELVRILADGRAEALGI